MRAKTINEIKRGSGMKPLVIGNAAITPVYDALVNLWKDFDDRTHWWGVTINTSNYMRDEAARAARYFNCDVDEVTWAWEQAMTEETKELLDSFTTDAPITETNNFEDEDNGRFKAEFRVWPEKGLAITEKLVRKAHENQPAFKYYMVKKRDGLI